MNAKLPTFFPKKLLPKSHLSNFFFNYKINLFGGFFFYIFHTKRLILILYTDHVYTVVGLDVYTLHIP